MADRTWNAVDARLYEEMWSKEARLVLGVIIARCPNPYGVYDIPFLILSTLFEKDEIIAALDELVLEDAVKLYRDRKVIWVIKKWRRAGIPNENQQKGAYNTVYGGFEEVWKDFQKYYKGFLRGIDGVSNPLPSESDTDSDSDTETEKIKKPVKSADDLPEPLQPTAKSQELIRKLVATGKKFKPVKQPDILKQAAVIDLINRKGSDETRDFHPDKLADALLWAVRDEDFWRAQVKSCLGLRRRAVNGCLKYENIMTAFERYQEKRFKTAWKSPEQRQREAKEQRDIEAENERKRIQREKEIAKDRKQMELQAEIDRKEQEAVTVKAKDKEAERLKQFIPDADKFMKLWSSKERYGLTSDAEIKTAIMVYMSEGIISGQDLIKKLKSFTGESWIDFQKILIAPDGVDFE